MKNLSLVLLGPYMFISSFEFSYINIVIDNMTTMKTEVISN